MKKTIKNYYDPTEISQAKKCLWNVYGDEVLGATNNRKGSALKSVNDFELDELINGLQKLDQKKLWNTEARFCACNVLRIPSHKPEEANLTSMVDRLAILEQQMKNVQGYVTLHTMQIGGVTSDVQRALTYKAMAASSATYVSRRSPLAQVMSEPHVQIKADGSEQKRKQKESVSGFHEGDIANTNTLPSQAIWEPEHHQKQAIIDGTKKKPSFVEAVPGQGPITVDMLSQAINDLPKGFQYQSAYQKKLRVTGNKKDRVEIHCQVTVCQTHP